MIFELVEFGEIGGAFELALFFAAVRGLEFEQQLERLFESAGEALRMSAEGVEGAGVFDECGGHGECILSVGMGCVDGGGVVGDAERKEIGLERRDAVELPGGVGEGLDELGFGGAFGLVFVEERSAVALVGGEIFGGQDDGVAGESMKL